MTERRLPRWIESSSDASPELRRALLELDERADSQRIARLEARFSATFGAAFGPPAWPVTAAPQVSNAPAVAQASFGATLGVKLGLVVVLGAAAMSGATALPAPSGVETLRSSSRVASVPAPHRTANVGSVTWPTAPRARGERPGLGRSAGAGVEGSGRIENGTPREAPAPVGSVSEEARLLRLARAESKSDPETALALLDEHERRFPRGALGDERDLFAIELLVRSGKRGEASERVNALRTRSPRSPYLDIGQRMLGEK
ncbi:MAG TPA: hypothetical protein VFZ53_29420 [Polyangiaceae bacterium]